MHFHFSFCSSFYFLSGKRYIIILVISEEEHDIYTRQNNDLIIEKKIKLGDAICGVKYEFKHINGEVLYINEDKVITGNEKRTLKNYGMPVKDSNSRGDLIIIYNVEYPTELCDLSKISEILQTTEFVKSESSKYVRTFDSNYSQHRSSFEEMGVPVSAPKRNYNLLISEGGSEGGMGGAPPNLIGTRRMTGSASKRWESHCPAVALYLSRITEKLKKLDFLPILFLLPHMAIQGVLARQK